ncbi:Ig-like domain-containing protein [Mycolicibacterium phlei]
MGVGLATALVAGQGVAAADTDDSTSSQQDDNGKGNAAADAAGAGSVADSGGSGADKGDSGDSEPDEGDDSETDLADEDLTEDKLDDDVFGDDDADDEADAGSEDAEQTDPEPDDNDPEVTPALSDAIEESFDGSNSSESSEPPVAHDTDPVGSDDDGADDTTIVPLAASSVPEESAPEESAPEETPAEGEASLEDVEIPPEYREAAEATILMVRELLRQLGVTGGNSAPTTPFGIVMQALWVSSRRYQDPWNMTVGAVRIIVETVVEATLADLSKTVGWIPGVGTLLYGASALYDAADLVIALVLLDIDDVVDEIQDLVRDVVGMIPIVGAPLAGSTINQPAVASLVRIGSVLASLGSASALAPPALMAARVAEMTETAIMAAAAVPQPGTAEWYFVGTLDRAVKRLAAWLPGIPKNFTDITQYTTDYTLDALNNQLDNIVATAAPGSPARWVPDLLSILGMFVTSAIPGYTFSDTLNTWGDFLNRVAPPFEMAPNASTFGIITPYKMMGAAVVGAATVLKDMLNGVYDPVQIEIDVIKATTGATVTASDLNDFDALLTKVGAAQAGAIFGGDGGAFDDPARAWNITLPTWTEAQTNPFTLAVYVGLVAVYKRFQEMARFTEFTTWTTYDSWIYTISLGTDASRSEYAAGTFHVVDDLGRPVTWLGVSQGGTYTSEGGALVTINTDKGGFTYTNTLPGKAFFHRATSENEEERYDVVHIPVESADGVRYTLPFKVLIIDGSNANPTAGTPTVGTPDALGVVRGKINASDSDGDTLTYRLVESSVNGLSGNSAYTKAGSGNGGVVTINPTTGDFTYISSATAGATQSFQVEVSDGHYGRAYVTVTVQNVTALTPANVTKPTYGVYSGSVPVPGNDAGLLTGFQLGAAPTKGTVTSFNPATGAFTYTRNSGLGHSTTPDDVVTLIATTADGRTVTLRFAVNPDVPNTPPVINSSTTNVGSSNPSQWGLNQATWTQTTTGKITATDADGDTLSFYLVNPSTLAPVGATTNGGAVTFNADGSWTYTITKDKAYFHNAAKIGASGAQVADTFTVAVDDGFGGVVYTTVTIPIYAVNTPPQISGYGNASCAFWLCTRGTMSVSDPDGDSIPNNEITPGTGAGWTLSAGDVTVWGSGTTTISWPAGGTLGTQQSANLFTVYDGYWTVTNGLPNVGTPSKAWVQWHAGGGTSYGN